MSRTGSGTSIQRSELISCWTRFSGKIANSASGGQGCLVPGCSGGGIGTGKSVSRLYQELGISACVRSKRVCMGNTESAVANCEPAQISDGLGGSHAESCEKC